jgi:hypothetical protein
MTNKSIDDQMKEDFALFMFIIWESLGYEPHKIQTMTARWIQNAPDRRALFAMRNFGKTLIIATLICWYFKRNPNATVLVQSATQQHSIKIVSFVRKLIETSPYLAEMKPKVESVGDLRTTTLWGRLRLEVGNRTIADKDPSLAAYGIGSQVTGSHVDHIIADDVETPENSRTVEARDKIREKLFEYEDVVNPGGTVTVIGTFQSTDAVLVDVVEKMGYTGIKIPSEYPDPLKDDPSGLGGMWLLADWLIEDLQTGRAKPGDATYPERWPLERLATIKEQSPSRYRMQRLLDPSLSDETRFPLKLRDLIVHSVDTEIGPRRILHENEKAMEGVPTVGIAGDRLYYHGHVGDEYGEYEQRVMWVDPAGTGENADEVGIAIGYMLNGLIRVPCWTGLKGGYSDKTLREIATLADKYKVKTIYVENAAMQGMFVKLLSGMVNSTLGLMIAVEHPDKTAASRGAKEAWICDTLEPLISNHRVILDNRVVRSEENLYQLTHVTRERGCLRHDDRIDALAGVCSLFGDQMFKDMDKAEKERRLEAKKQELKEWDREVRELGLGGPNRGRKRRSSWIR